MSKRKLIALSKSFLWSICILLFPILSGTLSAVLSLETTGTLLLQGTFMLLSLVIPLIFIVRKKWRWSEIGFAKIDADRCKKALYFLPTLVIFIPAAVRGFHIQSVPYVLGNLFLYLAVGLAEEIYFRGIIPKCLNEAFSRKEMIFLSSIIFGIGHIASAFTANNGWEIFLAVLNAVIFGWLAIEMAVICKSIAPVILLHFMFDFETKIVVMNGAALLTAECIRGVIMVIVALWFVAVIGKMEKVKNA